MVEHSSIDHTARNCHTALGGMPYEGCPMRDAL